MSLLSLGGWNPRLVRPSPLPGFGVTLAFGVSYLSLIELLPLTVLIWRAGALGVDGLWRVTTTPRVLAALEVSFLTSALAAFVNALVGTLVGEDDATDLSVRHRRVGFVFQHYALFKHMSVAENVAYGLRVRPRRLRPADFAIRQRVIDLLELVQLGGLGKRYPGQLSGGQRVALARALAVEPRVLLLDEPFGALDAQVRRDLRLWLRELHDRTGHATLFVTHDQEEALELADRVAILNHGRVEQIATPEEVLDRPATPFVAAFVGEATRLPVHASGLWICLGPHRVRQYDRTIKGSAELFVRPRDLTFAPNSDNAIPARVVGLRRTATASRVELLLAEGLPSVEIEMPMDSRAVKGKTLPVKLAIQRLFPCP